MPVVQNILNKYKIRKNTSQTKCLINLKKTDHSSNHLCEITDSTHCRIEILIFYSIPINYCHTIARKSTIIQQYCCGGRLLKPHNDVSYTRDLILSPPILNRNRLKQPLRRQEKFDTLSFRFANCIYYNRPDILPITQHPSFCGGARFDMVGPTKEIKPFSNDGIIG